ncbi:MAG TPA: UDP-N-acetylmuramate--L-alanine ligase [Myxococcota bacterium]|nr:UDP-N-acetylmuramate--L-alanine ligase [Myxococcota bacterium]
MRRRVQRVHFVGIGGVGMSGLAEILHVQGYSVSGSDLRESAATRRMRELGMRVAIGHAAEAVTGADVVVFSSAVSQTNPELRAAEAAGIPVIPRAELLSELMRMKYGVAIGGSAGKTTTTSMTAEVLAAGGLDPTTIVGGRVISLGANSRLGEGEVLVAEADESDGSFLRLVPTVVVITNIDRDHLDHYGSFEALHEAFVQFANRVPFYGAAVLCIDDPHVQTLLPRVTRRIWTYGLSPQADVAAVRVEAAGMGMRFAVRARGAPLGAFSLRVPGRHNVQNALAAVAVGLEFDVPVPRIAEALAAFRGVERRFEIKGERDGITVIDDYSHHPAKVRAALAAAREGLGRRIVVAYQPHRYTRTRDVFDELARAFHDADVVLLTEIYAAGEEKIAGVSAAALAEAVRSCGHRAVEFVPEKSQIVPRLRALARPGDLVFFMGAGDIGRLAVEFLAPEGGSPGR